MPAARLSEAVIRNAIKAAQACDVVIGQIEVTADGGIKIIAENAMPRYAQEETRSGW